MYINEIRIQGQLMEDVWVGNMQSGNRVASLRVKTGRPFRNKAGETEWAFAFHKVIVYNQYLVELLEKQAKGGRWVTVSGELSYNKNGRSEVVVGAYTGSANLMFTDLSGSDFKPSAGQGGQAPAPQAAAQTAAPSQEQNPPMAQPADDEIPF